MILLKIDKRLFPRSFSLFIFNSIHFIFELKYLPAAKQVLFNLNRDLKRKLSYLERMILLSEESLDILH